MTPLRRRVLAACVFALAFIFYYEARGQRFAILQWHAEEITRSGPQHFWEQAFIGTFVLLLGGFLLFTLRRTEEDPAQNIQWGERMVFALGLGILIGTLAISGMRVFSGAGQ